MDEWDLNKQLILKWEKELENTNEWIKHFTEQYAKANNPESLLRVIGQLKQEARLFESFINDLESLA